MPLRALRHCAIHRYYLHSRFVEKDIMPLRALRRLLFPCRLREWAVPVEKDIMPLRALRPALTTKPYAASSLWRKTSCPCGHCDAICANMLIDCAMAAWRKTSCPCGHCDSVFQSSSSMLLTARGERHHALAGIATTIHVVVVLSCSWGGERHHALAGIATLSAGHFQRMMFDLWRKTSCPCGHCDVVWSAFAT